VVLWEWSRKTRGGEEFVGVIKARLGKGQKGRAVMWGLSSWLGVEVTQILGRKVSEGALRSAGRKGGFLRKIAPKSKGSVITSCGGGGSAVAQNTKRRRIE